MLCKDISPFIFFSLNIGVLCFLACLLRGIFFFLLLLSFFFPPYCCRFLGVVDCAMFTLEVWVGDVVEVVVGIEEVGW